MNKMYRRLSSASSSPCLPAGPAVLLAPLPVCCRLLLRCLLVLTFPTLITACCSQEQHPITNCSFTYTSREDSQQNTALCEMINGNINGYRGMCYNENYGYTEEDNIPAGVKNLSVELFTTKCAPTMVSPATLTTPCDTSCRDHSGTFYRGLNVTFQVDEFTAEDLEAVEISLFGLSGPHQLRLWCEWFHIGRGSLSYNAAKQHLFHFDGFVGLHPNQYYSVSVKTLPTTLERLNQKSQDIRVPYEKCWKAEYRPHKTPFAINFTLFLADDSLDFTEYEINVKEDTSLATLINVEDVVTYQVDGRRGTLVTHECLPPRKYHVFIHVLQCSYCLPSRFSVNVKAGAPIIHNCPGNVTAVEERRETNRVLVDWEEPTYQTVCGDESGLELVSYNQSHYPSGSAFDPGLTLVSYFYQQYDAVAECSFFVNVTLVDTTPPEVIGCPSDIHVTASVGEDTVEVTWTEPSATDVSFPLIIRSSSQSGDHFRAGTNTTVIYQFIDAAGNEGEECSFEVFVQALFDNQPPVVTDCPDDIYIVADIGQDTVRVDWTEPTATDISLPIVIKSSSHSGDHFRAGTNTTVRYQFIDAAGNQREDCEFHIIVEASYDTAPPEVSGCPGDIHVIADIGQDLVIVNWTEPTATDVSLPIVIKSSPHNGDPFKAGTNTTVRYQFIDAVGNKREDCVFHVFVKATPKASPLVIALACVAGLFLIILIFVIILKQSWKRLRHRNTPSQSSTQSYQTNVTNGSVCTRPVCPQEPHVPIGLLEQAPSIWSFQSKFSPSDEDSVFLQNNMTSDPLQKCYRDRICSDSIMNYSTNDCNMYMNDASRQTERSNSPLLVEEDEGLLRKHRPPELEPFMSMRSSGSDPDTPSSVDTVETLC